MCAGGARMLLSSPAVFKIITLCTHLTHEYYKVQYAYTLHVIFTSRDTSIFESIKLNGSLKSLRVMG